MIIVCHGACKLYFYLCIVLKQLIPICQFFHVAKTWPCTVRVLRLEILCLNFGKATYVLDFLFFRIIKPIKAEYLYFYRHWTHFGNAQSSRFRCKEIRVCGMNNPVCAVVPGIEHYRIVSIHCFSSLSCSSQIWNTQTHLARSSFPSSFIRAQSDLA